MEGDEPENPQVVDEHCLRHLVQRQAYADVLWKGDSRELITKALEDLYGAKIGQDIAYNVSNQLIVSSFMSIAQEFETFVNNQEHRLNVRNVLSCVKHFEEEELDETAQFILLRVLIHCAMHFLLASKEISKAWPTADRMLHKNESIKESIRITDLRAEASLLLKKCAQAGLQHGTKSMAIKASKFEDDYPLNSLVRELKQYVAGIVDDIGDLWGVYDSGGESQKRASNVEEEVDGDGDANGINDTRKRPRRESDNNDGTPDNRSRKRTRGRNSRDDEGIQVYNNIAEMQNNNDEEDTVQPDGIQSSPRNNNGDVPSTPIPEPETMEPLEQQSGDEYEEEAVNLSRSARAARRNNRTIKARPVRRRRNARRAVRSTPLISRKAMRGSQDESESVLEPQELEITETIAVSRSAAKRTPQRNRKPVKSSPKTPRTPRTPKTPKNDKDEDEEETADTLSESQKKALLDLESASKNLKNAVGVDPLIAAEERVRIARRKKNMYDVSPNGKFATPIQDSEDSQSESQSDDEDDTPSKTTALRRIPINLGLQRLSPTSTTPSRTPSRKKNNSKKDLSPRTARIDEVFAANNVANIRKGPFLIQEDEILVRGLKKYGWSEWSLIANNCWEKMKFRRTKGQVKDRARYLDRCGRINKDEFAADYPTKRGGPPSKIVKVQKGTPGKAERSFAKAATSRRSKRKAQNNILSDDEYTEDEIKSMEQNAEEIDLDQDEDEETET